MDKPLENEKSKPYGGPGGEAAEKDYFDQVCYYFQKLLLLIELPFDSMGLFVRSCPSMILLVVHTA